MPRTSKSDVGLPLTVENLSKFTVAKLKQELTSRSLSSAGTKPVLIERLTEALESGPKDDHPASPKSPSKTVASPIKEAPKSPAKPASPVKEAPKSPAKPASPVKEAPKSPVKPASPVKEAPKSPAKPASPIKEAPKSPAKPASPVKEEPKSPAKPASPVKEAPKSPAKPAKPASPIKEAPKSPVKPVSPVKEAPNSPAKPASPIKDIPKIVVEPPKSPAKRPAESSPSSPSKKHKAEEEVSVYIEKFTRPLNMDALKAKLSEFGTVERFWMDRLRSHCYATFSKPGEANSACASLQGFSFQPGLTLSARPVTQQVMDQAIQDEDSKSRIPVPKFTGPDPVNIDKSAPARAGPEIKYTKAEPSIPYQERS